MDQGSTGPAEGPEPNLAAEAPSRATGERSGSRGRNALIEIAQTLLLTLVIFLVVHQFVAQPFRVEQHSMETTFLEGDYVLVDRLTPRWSPYARGQVVVFADEDVTDLPEPLIKRVIGVAGDTVEILDDGTVSVNGSVLDEPYLFRDDAGDVEPTVADGETSWVVPDGELFVMGDHRQVSADSRVFGPIPVSSVVGRGMLRYWPLSGLGIVATPAYENVPAP